MFFAVPKRMSNCVPAELPMPRATRTRFGWFLLLGPCMLGAAGQTAGTPHPAPSDPLRRGILDAQQGDYNEAVAAFRTALVTHPDSVEARIQLGEALAATKQYDAAIEEYQRVLPMAPDKTAVRFDLGNAYYRKGDFSHARSALETVCAARPDDVAAATLLASTYIKLDRYTEAADLLAPLEPGREENSEFEYVLAFTLIELGKAAEGLPRMEKVARATHSAQAFIVAGSTRLEKRDFREAQSDLEAALQLNPVLPGLQTMVGRARYALGDIEGATTAYQAALRADPRDFLANLHLGVIRLEQRDFEDARPLLEFALQLNPKFPMARFEMAKLYSLTERYPQALSLLEPLARDEPDWLDPHQLVATVYYKIGRPADARRERAIVQQLMRKQENQSPSNQR